MPPGESDTVAPSARPLPASPADGSEGVAPADLVPEPSRLARVAWYAGAVALTAVLLAGGLRLDRFDIHAPVDYNGDAALIMPLVKNTIETGTHWRNARMGYPGVQELYDFPIVDHLHLAIIWALGRVIRDWIVVYNVYFLLTWPLTTLTAMAALRQLRLTLPMAAVGGVLYAFLPYHYLRGESHYFLAAYWVVPLSWLPALALCRGDFPFFRRGAGGDYRPAVRTRAAFWHVVLAAATASAGAYYAFFACAIYGFSGVYAGVKFRSWRAVAAAAALVALVGGFGVVNHAPAFGYAAAHGRNGVTERFPEEAETYGLKIAHLVFPIDGHNLTAFAQLKSAYNSDMRSLNNENTCAPLGAVGAVGLVGLLGSLVLPVRPGWPYAPLAALAGFIVLFSLIGGFGGVFNQLVMDQVRCYNRMSVYLAFVCLFATLWATDGFLATRTGWARRVRYPAAAALLAIGFLDQTPYNWFRPQIVAIIGKDAARFQADRRFFARVEEAVPPGSKVFMLPYVQYPEIPSLHRMDAYEHARGYLFTDTLVWSYGGMKNREVDAWQADVARDKPAEFLRRVVARGFDGVFVDKRGFVVTNRNQGDVLLSELKQLAGVNGRVKIPEVVHADGEQVFLDLRPYRDWLRGENPGQFEAWAKAEAEWATVTWLHGFWNTGAHGENGYRWGYKSSTAVVVNPADRTRRFRLSLAFGVDDPGEFRLDIDGGGLVQLDKDGGPGPWADTFTLVRHEWGWGPLRRPARDLKAWLLEVPPGRHRVKFRCTPPPKFLPSDSRPICYYIHDIKLVEQ